MKHLIKCKKKYFFISVFLFILYGKTLFFSFVTDDWFNIIENSNVFSLYNVKDIFLTPQINFGKGIYYRPLDTIYFLFTLMLFGNNYLFYHLLNLILLAIFSYCLFKLVNKHLKYDVSSFFIVLLFISHPLLVEPVAWISARNQIIEGILFLSSLFFLEKILKSRGLLNYVGLILTIIGALFFHDIGVMLLPIIIAYVTIFYYKEFTARRIWVVLVLITLLFLFFIYMRNKIVPIPLSDQPLKIHILTSIIICSTYLKNIFLPFNLKVHYYDLVIKQTMDKEVLIGLAIIICAAAIIFVLSKRNKLSLFGTVFLIMTLFPASGITNFIQKSLISDRYAFMPLVGILLILNPIFSNVIKKKAGKIVLIAIIVVFSIYNFVRQDIWKDDLSNALQRVKEFPEHPVERANLAAEYIKLNRIEDAEKELVTAFNLAKKPEESVYINYAMVASLKGDLALTEKMYLKYLEFDSKSHRTLYNLGTLYLERGDKEKAKYYLEEAKKYVQPYSYEYADILNNLGVIAFLNNDKEKAKYYFEEVIKIRPYDTRYRKNLELIK